MKNEEATLSTFPNPFQNEISFQTQNVGENFMVRIFDNSGKCAFEQAFQVDPEKELPIVLQLSNLDAGVYELQIISAESVRRCRIVKE